MDEKKMLNPDLDPEVIKVRDKIISKIGDKPLDDVNSIIKKLLNESMDDVTRLGALAARLKIIRSKIDLLYERKVEIKPKENVTVSSEKIKNDKENEDVPTETNEKWIRIKMLEAGDVNGKQIDKGVILDVKEEDSKKLLDTKKAEIVEELADGASPIQKTDENKELKENEEKKSVNLDKEEMKSEPAFKQDIKDDKKSESSTASNDEKNDESSEDEKKSKNLLEKHEDAVSDDDKKQEINKKSEETNSNKEHNEIQKDNKGLNDSSKENKDNETKDKEKSQEESKFKSEDMLESNVVSEKIKEEETTLNQEKAEKAENTETDSFEEKVEKNENNENNENKESDSSKEKNQNGKN